VLQRVDVETVDSLGRMVEDVVGAAVDSLPEEDTALIQQIIQAAELILMICFAALLYTAISLMLERLLSVLRKVTDENSRIRIRYSELRIRESGSVPKFYGSATLVVVLV
jgi:hypothetical protein